MNLMRDVQRPEHHHRRRKAHEECRINGAFKFRDKPSLWRRQKWREKEREITSVWSAVMRGETSAFSLATSQTLTIWLGQIGSLRQTRRYRRLFKNITDIDLFWVFYLFFLSSLVYLGVLCVRCGTSDFLLSWEV